MDTMAEPLVTMAAIEEAARRLAGQIRRTPMVEVTCVRDRPVDNPIFLKMECLQVTGAFKARGATHRLLTTDRATIEKGIVTASGGNHGMAVARAGVLAGVPATIFLPPQASPAKIRALKGWGADARVVGKSWDDANLAARAFAAETGAIFFHPFADPAVVAGNGTVALEMMEDLPDADVYLVAIGGGGLISGVSTVVKAKRPQARVIGVEPEGSPTLHASLAAGEVATLPELSTRVATMACGRTADSVFEVVRRNVDEIVLVSDEDMVAAARWIWAEFAVRADLSSAAAIAALRRGRVRLAPGEVISTLVCGADDAAIDPEA